MIRILIALCWTILFLLLIGNPILLYKTVKIQNELKQIHSRIESMFESRNDTLQAVERQIRAEALAKMVNRNKLRIGQIENEFEKAKRKPK